MQSTKSGRPRNSGALAAALGGVAVLALVLGSDTFCLSKLTLGLPCPGCGLGRAYMSLFRGEIAEAFHWHPLFLAVPIVIGTYFFRNRPPLDRLYRGTLFWAAAIGLFVGVWILRMALFFPANPPLDYNEKSLLWAVFSALRALW